MRKKKPQSNIEIKEEDIAKRIVSISPISHNDYLDEGYRRIFPESQKIEFENKIFNERVGICLKMRNYQ